MPLFIKDRWPLFFVLLIFIVCKVPHLFYPYYWDESWSYLPALHAMHQHGISLMPNALDPQLSRGHPLLFYALATAWMDIFGTSHLALHSFALLISILFLTVVYEAGRQLFNLRVAVTSILLIVTLELFFVQSSFLLPEVMVALFAFLSLCFYVKEKYLLAAISLTALFFTKESGIVLGIVLGADAVIGLFNISTDWKARTGRLTAIIIPCLLIATFFLLQKHLRGWYVFPDHVNLIDYSWRAFWYKFRMSSIKLAFYDNYKFWLYDLLMICAVIAAIKNKNVRYLAILLPGIIIYYFVDDMRAGRLLPPIPFFIVFILAVIFFLYVYAGKAFYKYAYQRRFIVLASVFIFCFFCFSTINFFTYRYLLEALVPLLFITAVFLDRLIAHSYKPLYYVALISILVAGFFSFKNDDGYGDSDMGAYDAMYVQTRVINFFERNIDHNKNIVSNSFLEQQHLSNPYTGFLHTTNAFNNVKWDINSSTDYVIFDNIEPDARYNQIMKDTLFQRIYRVEKGKLWAEVYARK